MKKLLLLLLTLFLGVSASWADVDAPTGYVSSIETGVNYLWGLCDAASGKVRYIHADGTKTASYAHLTGAGIFQFEDAGDGYYYIKNVNSGNYIYTDYAGSVTLNESANGKPYACSYNDKSVLSAGTKADEDKFKWLVSEGSTTNGFFISSKANSNAVIAATSQGTTWVDFYQYTVTYNGNAKYPFANSKFIKVATSLTELSNNRCYNICNYQAWWAVGSSATEVNSTYANSNGLNLAVSTTDTKQQFAFIKYIDKYYLYSVGEGKFAYKNGTKLSLADGFNNNVTSNGAVTFVTSTSSSYKSSAPVVVTVATKNFGVSTGYTPTVYGYDSASDPGNASAVCEAGSFTSTTALAQIESSFLFEPSTDLAPKYYAWRTAVSNNPSYIHIESGAPKNQNNHNITVTDPIDAAYAWYFIGDPENGYAIKNKSTGTYLGGRTKSGGAMSMEASANCKFYPINEATATPTWNTWYDKEHNYYIDRSSGAPYAHTSGNKNDYIRLYNVKFSLSNAAAGLVVGSTTISDFNAYYLITSSASLSCAESGYTITSYDGYGTLAEALTNDADGTIELTIQQSVDVTFKLKWNGDVIKSVERAEVVGEAPTAATTVFGTVPAYSSYGTPDVATIASNTTEVNVDLNWSASAPFTFSANYEDAIWYCMQIQGTKWLSIGTITDGVASVTLSDNPTITNSSLWAYLGNPIDGIKLINKGAGDGYYGALDAGGVNLNVQSGEENALLFSIEEGTNAFLLKKSDGKYMEFLNNGKVGFWGTTTYQTYNNINVRSYYCQKLIEDIYDWADANHRNELFGPSESWLTSKESQIISMFPNMSKSTYDGVTIPDDFLPIVPNYPTTGYYRIKNNATNNYLAYGYASRSDSYTERNDWGLITTSSSTDAASVIKLTGSAGTYKISTQGLNVQSSTNFNKAFPVTSAEGADWVFTVISPGIVAINNAASYVDANKNGDLHEGTDGWNDNHHGVINWNRGAENSRWVVEAAESITIPLTAANDNSGEAHTYATLCVPFNITNLVGADSKEVKAYAPTKSGDYIVPGTGATTITEGTPVMLIGEEGALSVTATIGSNYATSPATTNALTGTFAGTSIDCTAATGTNYVLGFDSDNDNRIGFYHVNNENFPLSANRAYLKLDGSRDPAHVKGFVISWDEETGLTEVQGSKFKVQGDEIFNLAGQRLSRMQKGINIIGGKKILVK